MPMPLPPRPLSKEEFRKRIDAGAKTMDEIDPALAKWKKDNDRFLIFGSVAIIIGVLGLLFVLILAAMGII